MSILEAIFLGIIQGATEFLPISSSGHLILIPHLFNMGTPDLNLIAVAHGGTLLAVLIYFRHDLWQIGLAVLAALRLRQPLATAEARLGWYIVVGSIPAAVIGLTLEDFFNELFGHPVAAAFFLLATAALLVFGERMLAGIKQPEEMTWSDALTIGLFQALALLPGISRSGSTIVAGLWRGLDRPGAARYSFLLSVPAVTGAALLAFMDLSQVEGVTDQIPALFTTFVVSGIVGYACIHFLLQWLRRRSLYGFAIYCATFAILFLIVAAVR